MAKARQPRIGDTFQGHGDNFTVTVQRREKHIPGYWRCHASDGRSMGIDGEALMDRTLYRRR